MFQRCYCKSFNKSLLAGRMIIGNAEMLSVVNVTIFALSSSCLSVVPSLPESFNAAPVFYGEVE